MTNFRSSKVKHQSRFNNSLNINFIYNNHSMKSSLSVLLMLLVCLSCKPDEKKVDSPHDQKEPKKETIQVNEIERLLNKLTFEDDKYDANWTIIEPALTNSLNKSNTIEAQRMITNVLRNVAPLSDSKKYVEHIALKIKGIKSLEHYFKTLNSAMVVRYPNDPYSLSLKSTVDISSLINTKKDEMMGFGKNKMDVHVAKQYIDMVELYMMVTPDDKYAGHALFEGGNVARSLPGFNRKALEMYSWLVKAQPNHPKAPEALFLSGFIADEDLKDLKTAKYFYAKFLEKYPKHKLAENVQLLADNLGKSNEQLFQEIVEKKK